MPDKQPVTGRLVSRYHTPTRRVVRVLDLLVDALVRLERGEMVDVGQVVTAVGSDREGMDALVRSWFALTIIGQVRAYVVHEYSRSLERALKRPPGRRNGPTDPGTRQSPSLF